MTTVYRAFVPLTGWIGAPGVNVLHFTPGVPPMAEDQAAQYIADEVHSLYNALKTVLVGDCIVQGLQFVDVLDENTGLIVDQYSVPNPPNSVVGTNTGEQTSRSQAICATLRGDRFLNGRRMMGRVFIGPAGNTVLEGKGQIQPGFRQSVVDAFQNIISGVGPRLAVYHRPALKGGSDGTYCDVSTVSVGTTMSNLRSRGH